MTCIVGLAHEGEVWMGGDSYRECGDVVYRCNDSKIFFAQEPESERRILIGAAGDAMLSQIAKMKIELPVRRPEWNDGEYIALGVCEVLSDAINAHMDRLRVKKWPDGCYMFGYQGQLYSADRKMTVMHQDGGSLVIGWGDEVATGALEATFDLEPQERIKRALEAASRRTSKVAPPFHFLKL